MKTLLTANMALTVFKFNSSELISIHMCCTVHSFLSVHFRFTKEKGGSVKDPADVVSPSTVSYMNIPLHL